MGMYIDTATSILVLMRALPQTSTVAGYTATVDIVEAQIPRAESFVNGKVIRRYDVSGFSSGAAVQPLKTLAEDITCYYTYRELFTSDNQNENEWTDKYYLAVDMLDQIMKGDLDILDSDNNIIEERQSSSYDRVESNTEDYAPTFDEGSVLDWENDPDKISDIEDSK